MPNYDFLCTACDERFVKNMPLGTQSTPCPTCGQAAKKSFTVPAIHFAGKGFYSVDSRANAASATSVAAPQPAPPAPTAPAAPPADKAAAKTEGGAAQ